MATNSLDVIEKMLTAIEREISVSLRQINQSPEWFDGSFEQYFLHALNSRAASTYSKFKVELQLVQCDATEAVVGNSQNRNICNAGNDSNRSSGNFGRSIKAESIGEVIELSDDDDVEIIPKKEANEELSAQNAHIGNEQKETTTTKEFTSNNRSMQNGESPTVKSVADSDVGTLTEIANDRPSPASGMGAEDKDASTNVDRLGLVVELRRCDEVEGSSSAKNKQKTANGKQKRHICQICGFTAQHKGHLNVHIRKHTGERPYQCNKCSKTFSQSSSLNVHQLIHVKQYEFRCVGCARGFIEEIEKLRHEKVCKKRRYECYLCKIDPPYCERTYVTFTITNLKTHMLVHTGEKPFRCEICMKQFRQKQHLKRHLDTIHSRTNR